MNLQDNGSFFNAEETDTTPIFREKLKEQYEEQIKAGHDEQYSKHYAVAYAKGYVKGPDNPVSHHYARGYAEGCIESFIENEIGFMLESGIPIEKIIEIFGNELYGEYLKSEGTTGRMFTPAKDTQ